MNISPNNSTVSVIDCDPSNQVTFFGSILTTSEARNYLSTVIYKNVTQAQNKQVLPRCKSITIPSTLFFLDRR